MLAWYMPWPCVCPSITSWYCTIMVKYRIIQTSPPPPPPFYSPSSWASRVSQCQKKASSWLDSAREYNKRQTHWQSGPISHPPPSIPPIFLRWTPFLPQPSQFIPIGLGQAQEYAGLHTPVAWITTVTWIGSCQQCCTIAQGLLSILMPNTFVKFEWVTPNGGATHRWGGLKSSSLEL